MSYPRQNHPEIPYWAAQKLEKINIDLPRIVLMPEHRGEEFGTRARKVLSDLAQIRRGLIAEGIAKEDKK